MIETDRKNKLLNDIAELIVKYEDPTGSNCSNDVSIDITLDYGRKTEQTFSFNGESFVRIR